MKKLISIILTTALTLSMFSCANCFADKSTTAQSKIINAKTSSLNETRNAVDKTYGSTPRKTSRFKKFLFNTIAVTSSFTLLACIIFKDSILDLFKYSIYSDDEVLYDLRKLVRDISSTCSPHDYCYSIYRHDSYNCYKNGEPDFQDGKNCCKTKLMNAKKYIQRYRTREVFNYIKSELDQFYSHSHFTYFIDYFTSAFNEVFGTDYE